MPKEEKDKKALIIVPIIGLGALIAWLFRNQEIDPNKAILYGMVTDAETTVGIANINVNCDGYMVKTDSKGEYSIINIPPSTYSVTFTDPYGRYEPMTI